VALAFAQTAFGRKAFSTEIPASDLVAGIDAGAASLILDVRTPGWLCASTGSPASAQAKWSAGADSRSCDR
jgi:hypothetical protein